MGTFLSGVPLPDHATVSCPPPPGGFREDEGLRKRIGDPGHPPARRWPPLFRKPLTRPGVRGGVPAPTSSRTATSGPTPEGPAIVPCLMIRGGHVVVPEEGGPEIARDPGGTPYEIFDVLDSLAARYPKLYVVDLDGVERQDPQLDYLQEIARDTEVWVDAGVRNSDQAIDALITGASRAVLSTSVLWGPPELERAWALSQDLAFEISIYEGRVEAASEAWRGRTPEEVAAAARAVGVADVILSPRDADVDWSLVRRLSAGGPTWVGGSFDSRDLGRLRESGASGGIFHLGGDLLRTPEGSPWSSVSVPSPGPRRDENQNRLNRDE